MTSSPQASSEDPAADLSVVMRGESHDSSTFTQIGTQVILPPPPVAPLVRCTLPPDTQAFTGRGGELDQITSAVAGAGGVAVIRAIDGTPGVGKTALAVHAAHVLADRFPDRQLFIDLHAHTPGQDPIQPEDALARLLTETGIDPRFVPHGLDERMGMWRHRMAGQRALLVLDNAASSSQVTPLLPGGNCLVLVTSRRHLGDLPGLVIPVLLDSLPADQAEEMFVRLAPRGAADLAGVAEVVRLAGFLPLAISLLARVFARHSSWTLADLAAETRDGLLTLTAEHNSIATAFEVSYRHLDPAQQRSFRLLGLHPGATIDAWAAAALAGTSRETAAGLLDGLHGEGLLTEIGYRQYGMHDLLRRYARDRAAAEAPAGNDQALDQLLDYYQHTAARAQTFLARQNRPGAPLAASARPVAAPALNNAAQALAWARANRDNLLACLDHARRADQRARVIALTEALAEVLRRDGPWAEAITRHAAAWQAARQLDDWSCQANALASLGDARLLTGDLLGAAGDFEQALTTYRDLGDRLGQANALTWLGDVRRHSGDYLAAARDLKLALITYRDLGDQLGQANALTRLADVRRLTGNFAEAASDFEQALTTYRDLGDRLGQANALTWLGDVRRLTGDFPEAIRDLERALALCRDVGDRRGQAFALTWLADVRRVIGEVPQAARDLELALGLYRDLGDRRGQASALTCRGNLKRQAGDYPGAARDLEQALTTYRDLGGQIGQANALTSLGSVRRQTGDHPGAIRDLEQAVAIYRDLGDRQGEAEALNERGIIYRTSSELTKAEECHRQALELARAIASAWDEARALAGLGRCAVDGGQPEQAKTLLQQAHEIFRRIGAADAHSVLSDLSVLTSM